MSAQKNNQFDWSVAAELPSNKSTGKIPALPVHSVEYITM
jgi:hypothetical protein